LKNIRGPDGEEWLPDGSLGKKERKKNNETLLLVKKNLEKAKGKQRRVNNLWLSRRLVFGRGSERRISELRLAIFFRTSKLPF
jgi:hypothetical protein